MDTLRRTKWVAIVILASAACTPWRVPPTVSVADAEPPMEPGHGLVETVADDLEPHAESMPDLLVTYRAPSPKQTWPRENGAPEPRVVMRGGQEVLIGEPDRVRQNWIDEHGYLPPGCPLAVSFDGAPIELGPTPAHDFDLRGSTSCAEADWPSPTTPWLVFDRDGNGTIDDGRELFGTGTRLPGGELASNGFAALAPLDANADRRITAEDPAWRSLQLWSDHDADRRSDPTELTSLDDAGILALDLDFESSPRCDARGNCEIERAPMSWTKAGDREPRQGALVDIHLRCR